MFRYLVDHARRHRREARERRHLPDAQWREALAAAGVPVTDAALAPDGGLRLEGAGLDLPRRDAAMAMLPGAGLMASLHGECGADLQWDPGHEAVRVHHDGVSYLADGVETLWILRELLLQGDYDLLPCRPSLIVDVGANVGLASLFLAHGCPDARVVAYEPLEQNLERARENLALNPSLAARIEIVQAALMDAEGTGTLRSIPGHRGRSSLVATPVAPGPHAPVEEFQVTLRRASDELSRLRGAHPDRALVLKLDCEGAESAIVNDLARSGELAHVEACLMEWHTPEGFADAPERLRDTFHDAGFHVYVRGRHRRPRPDGLMLAIRAAKHGGV